ncbi:probable CoA ligase CCL6 [Rosa rugosa]|uniref:probable CoA ligase CCL6 n=1 Tax=Rosa rugosa TaxID=74645 RepID=UPI002B412BD4|nr:probable CoA ligase CCL6 [Rosa rugosa]
MIVYTLVKQIHQFELYRCTASKVSSGGVLRKALFQYAYNYKLANLEKGLPQEKVSPLLDKLVFNKIKQALGGRVRIMLSGSASLPRHVEEFFRVTSFSTLSQGYDLGLWEQLRVISCCCGCS